MFYVILCDGKMHLFLTFNFQCLWLVCLSKIDFDSDLVFCDLAKWT